MLIYLFIASFFLQASDTLTVSLQSEYIETAERIGMSILKFEEGFYHINENLTRCLSAYHYIEDISSYSSHAPVKIEALSGDSIRVLFDDNGDGIFDDRVPLCTKMQASFELSLLFRHSEDPTRDISIKCTMEARPSPEGLRLLSHYKTSFKGHLELEGQNYEIKFWESLGKMDLWVNDQFIKSGNPIRLGTSYYKVKSVDPVAASISFYRLPVGEKLYGNRKGLFINKEGWQRAFDHHGFDLDGQDTANYSLFYFWGHWCHPCMEKMPLTAATFERIKDSIAIYSVSYLLNTIDEEKQRNMIQGIIDNYDLPGTHFIELYKKGREAKPFIDLFDNRTYPNYILMDSEYKILYIQDASEMELEEFLDSVMK